MGFKGAFDQLKHLGIIEDDSPAHVNREYRWEKAKPKAGHVTIEIQEG